MRLSCRLGFGGLAVVAGCAGALLAGPSTPAASATAATGGWKVHLLPADSEVVGMSENGAVATIVSVEERGAARDRIGVWRAGRLRSLRMPGWDCRLAGGDSRLDEIEAAGDVINDAGQVIGSCSMEPRTKLGEGKSKTVLWTIGSRVTTFPERFTPVAINERGQVIGSLSVPRSPLYHAALWQNGRIRDLGTTRGAAAAYEPVAINDRGQAIVRRVTERGDWYVYRALLWAGGRMRDLGSLGGEDTDPVAINDRGQVVGISDLTSKGDPLLRPWHAFLWENGTMRDLGASFLPQAINDRGDVVGIGRDNRAVLWRRGHLIDLGALPGFAESVAMDVNDAGQVVCDVLVESERTPPPKLAQFTAFVWENGRRTRLPLPPQATRFATALAIDEHGRVIGNVDGERGIVWSR